MRGMTALDLQPSLFSAAVSADRRALPDMQRTHLSHGAWIDHLEGWLSDDLEVMDTLRDAVAWRQGSRTMYDRVVDVPRLTA